MAKLRLKNALFCEHIAPEIGEKFTLSGVSGGDLKVASFPATLRMAIYTEFISEIDGEISTEIEIKVSGNTLLKGLSKGNIKRDESVIIITPNFFHTVTAPGQLEVFISVEGETPLQVLSRKIGQAT